MFQDTEYLKKQVSNEREKQEKWKHLYYETSKLQKQQRQQQQQQQKQQSSNTSIPTTSISTVGVGCEPVDLNNNQGWMRPPHRALVGHIKIIHKLNSVPDFYACG